MHLRVPDGARDGDGMRAITVRQPWAAMISETAALTALGVAPKAVENRSRGVSEQFIGTDIAIHAGATWSAEGAADERVRRAWAVFANAIDLREPNPLLAAHGDNRTGYVGPLQPGLWIDTGAVVAVATLVDCHPAITIPALPGHPAHTCCQPWGEPLHNGRTAHHLALDHVRRLREPVPARGSLTVPWALPDDVEAAVLEQLAVVAS